MPILILSSKKELLAVTGMRDENYKIDIFRGSGAAAFGVPRPVLEDRPSGSTRSPSRSATGSTRSGCGASSPPRSCGRFSTAGPRA
jgi:hypothetical protein